VQLVSRLEHVKQGNWQGEQTLLIETWWLGQFWIHWLLLKLKDTHEVQLLAELKQLEQLTLHGDALPL